MPFAPVITLIGTGVPCWARTCWVTQASDLVLLRSVSSLTILVLGERGSFSEIGRSWISTPDGSLSSASATSPVAVATVPSPELPRPLDPLSSSSDPLPSPPASSAVSLSVSDETWSSPSLERRSSVRRTPPTASASMAKMSTMRREKPPTSGRWEKTAPVWRGRDRALAKTVNDFREDVENKTGLDHATARVVVRSPGRTRTRLGLNLMLTSSD